MKHWRPIHRSAHSRRPCSVSYLLSLIWWEYEKRFMQTNWESKTGRSFSDRFGSEMAREEEKMRFVAELNLCLIVPEYDYGVFSTNLWFGSPPFRYLFVSGIFDSCSIQYWLLALRKAIVAFVCAYLSKVIALSVKSVLQQAVRKIENLRGFFNIFLCFQS